MSTSKVQKAFEMTCQDDCNEAPNEIMSTVSSKRAVIVGTGLIGASIGLALREQGWHVSGTDMNIQAAEDARRMGAVDEIGTDPGADVGIVATPVGAVVPLARRLLEEGVSVVTDVGSVKATIVRSLDARGFVGGHPMAGSEQVGIQGARADSFAGAAWVLLRAPALPMKLYS